MAKVFAGLMAVLCIIGALLAFIFAPISTILPTTLGLAVVGILFALYAFK